jgi:molecular chaperone DnaJ
MIAMAMPAFENGGPSGQGGFGGFGASSFSDIFDDLFGGMGGRRGGRSGGRERGADLRYNLEISLEEAFSGKNAKIELPTNVACETCSGTGAKAGTQPVQCKTCQGSGRIRHAQGFFTLERTCASCQGRGSVITDPCKSCNGAGRVVKERTLEVNIPAGVEDGTRIRLGGEGEAGMRGGGNGDLYIFLSVTQHPIFQREGADLYCRVPVSMVTATIGGEFDVPTVDGGRSKVKIPEGTQTGKRFKLARQRHAGAALARARRHVCAGRGGDAPEADQAAERTSERIRQGKLEGYAAGIRRIFRENARVFRVTARP